MPQHALRSENNQRLAPRPQHLPPQQMKVLCGCRRLADLHVVAGSQLQIALDACARMLRSLALVAMRQQHHNPAQKPPFVLACGDELVDYDLRAIGKIAELRLPQNQGLGIITAVSIFEAEHTGFRQDRVVHLVLHLLRREMI